MAANDQALRSIRIVHLVMIASSITLVTMGELLGNSQAGPEDSPIATIQLAMFVVVLANLGFVALYRSRWVSPAVDALRVRPDDEERWNRWRVGNLLCLVTCETFVLFGFFLRMVGGTILHSAPFYAIGFVLLLLFTPRNPATS